ncbi:hypothetical protein VTP01DRAFT_4488 [Rhizomucor pusillus]|uniref:uncharacterized protein n=1 Tax=Rhizomucor pusillus TaxID=4840 RepID=UPI0037448345
METSEKEKEFLHKSVIVTATHCSLLSTSLGQTHYCQRHTKCCFGSKNAVKGRGTAALLNVVSEETNWDVFE